MNAEIPDGKKMKMWDELGKSFAEDIDKDYQYSSALDAISAYEDLYGRISLVAKLKKELLVDSLKIGDTHTSFCEIPFDKVCTTNFDNLLEKGYESLCRVTNVIVEEGQMALPTLKTSVEILKIHGDTNHPDQLVATEEDYDSYSESHKLIATYLCSLLIRRTAIFIGYSLEDYDFRQIFQLIKARLGKMRRSAYIIVVDANETARKRFVRRGLNVINLKSEGKSYGETLTEMFKEIKEYRDKTTTRIFTASKSFLNQEIIKPKRQNKLCFFFSSNTVLDEYKEPLYKKVKETGYYPVDYSDLLGDNFYGELSIAVNNSAYVFFDLDSDMMLSDNFNLHYDKDHLFFLTKTDIELSKTHGFVTIKKKYDKYNCLDIDKLTEEILGKIKVVVVKLKAFYDNVIDLKEKGFYSQALIASVTYMEVYLQSKADPEDKHNPMSLYMLLKASFDNGEHRKNRIPLQNALRYRNSLVHGEVGLIPKETVIPLIETILEEFPMNAQ